MNLGKKYFLTYIINNLIVSPDIYWEKGQKKFLGFLFLRFGSWPHEHCTQGLSLNVQIINNECQSF